MSLSKSFKKDEVKSGDKSERDFNYDSNYRFYKFFKGYDEFKEMALDSKYNRIKEYNNFFTNFKALRSKKKKHNSKMSEL